MRETAPGATNNLSRLFSHPGAISPTGEISPTPVRKCNETITSAFIVHPGVPSLVTGAISVLLTVKPDADGRCHGREIIRSTTTLHLGFDLFPERVSVASVYLQPRLLADHVKQQCPGPLA